MKTISEMYLREKMSAQEIANTIRRSKHWVQEQLKKAKVKTRNKSEARKLKTGSQVSNWNGGMFLRSTGYMMQLAPGHPNVNRWNYVKRADRIAEEALGRYLKKKGVSPKDREVVHHINGIKDDDRPSNLLICTDGYHKSLHHKMRRRK